MSQGTLPKTPAAITTTILALDLGKFKSIACRYDPATGEVRPMLVVEACSVCGWIADLAESLSIEVRVANTLGEAWKWRRVKRKTDRGDALKLAKLAASDQLPLVHVPQLAVRQHRSLIRYHHALIDRRTGIKNQVRSIYSQQGLSLPPRGKAWTKIGIKPIDELARPLAQCESTDDLWRGRLHVELHLLETLNVQIEQVDAKLDALGAADDRVQLLQSVPGVGPRLAQTVVAHLDDPHRFKSAAHVASYVGLVPKQIETGTMKRSGRITRRGSALLRSMLVEVATGATILQFHGTGPWTIQYVNPAEDPRHAKNE